MLSELTVEPSLQEGQFVRSLAKKGRAYLQTLERLGILQDGMKIGKKGAPKYDVIVPSMAKSQSTTPSGCGHWWGEVEDKNLLIGVYLCGDKRYDLIKTHPDLIFASRLESLPTAPSDTTNSNTQEENNEEKSTNTPSSGKKSSKKQSGKKFKGRPKKSEKGDGWPNSSALSKRFRALIAALGRELKKVSKQQKGNQAKLDKINAEKKLKEKKEAEKERKKLEQKLIWVKKEKVSTQKTLIMFGHPDDEVSVAKTAEQNQLRYLQRQKERLELKEKKRKEKELQQQNQKLDKMDLDTKPQIIKKESENTEVDLEKNEIENNEIPIKVEENETKIKEEEGNLLQSNKETVIKQEGNPKDEEMKESPIKHEKKRTNCKTRRNQRK